VLCVVCGLEQQTLGAGDRVQNLRERSERSVHNVETVFVPYDFLSLLFPFRHF
jgi:hypothetical protein